MPHDLMNLPVNSAIMIFATSQLSSWIRPTRLRGDGMAFRLRPGGLTENGQALGVRTIPPLRSHHPVETPEGPNIGLIVSGDLCHKSTPRAYQTPHRLVKERQVNEG
jgi:DNA-directed RNA polymerase subunit beta